MGNTVKLTISLPADLVRLTDETAQMEKKPRSRVIKEALTPTSRRRNGRR